MRWFRRGRRARSGGRAAADIDDGVVRCATGGQELDGDPDEDPTGDAGLPVCGECARANHLDVLDYLDGEFDGRIG